MAINRIGKQIQKDMDAIVKKELAQRQRDAQREFDRLHNEYADRPETEVRPEVEASNKRLGLGASSAMIDEWVTAISAGTEIEFRVEHNPL